MAKDGFFVRGTSNELPSVSSAQENASTCLTRNYTETTLEKLRIAFATHALPEVLVSDNGSVFTSDDFNVFAGRNGIRHVTSAPYHPSSNGLVEQSSTDFQTRYEEARQRKY